MTTQNTTIPVVVPDMRASSRTCAVVVAGFGGFLAYGRGALDQYARGAVRDLAAATSP